MAQVFWQRVHHPVRVSITAAYILRKLATLCRYVDRAASGQMERHAAYWEDLATSVQKVAQRDDCVVESELSARRQSDSQRALAALDCPMEMWTGHALLDLAVISGCHRFLEECCPQALMRRLFGDIDPSYALSWGGCVRLMVGILSLGFIPAFFPNYVKWLPPPHNSAMRGKMQRRMTPTGFPHNPLSNAVLRNMQRRREEGSNPFPPFANIFGWRSRNKVDKFWKLMDCDARQLKESPDSEIEMLWEPTFTPLQRLDCFFSCPIILFLTNALVTIVVTLYFTDFFWRVVPTPTSLLPSELMGAERLLAIYFFCLLKREIVQMMIAVVSRSSRNTLVNIGAGLRVHLSSFWNLMEIGAIAGFALGLAARCSGAKGNPFSRSWPLCYAVSIACCWMCVARVFSITKLGIIVNILLQMFVNIIQFVSIYVLFLIATSLVLFGAMVVHNCGTEGQEALCDSEGCQGLCAAEAENWPYWFARTLFSSFGESHLTDFEFRNVSSSAPGLLGLMVFLMSNVALLNLLIAMMASTYEDIRQQALRQRLLDLYTVSREHNRRAMMSPIPFNVLFYFWSIAKFVFIYPRMLEREYPECSHFHRLALFMTRNEDFAKKLIPADDIWGMSKLYLRLNRLMGLISFSGSSFVSKDRLKREFDDGRGEEASPFLIRARSADLEAFEIRAQVSVIQGLQQRLPHALPVHAKFDRASKELHDLINLTSEAEGHWA